MKTKQLLLDAINNTVDWLFVKKFRNVLIEIDNECDAESYHHSILKSERVHELIELVKNKNSP